jgi:hypothetical protein
VAGSGRGEMHAGLWMMKPEKMVPFENKCFEGQIILKCMLNRLD